MLRGIRIQERDGEYRVMIEAAGVTTGYMTAEEAADLLDGISVGYDAARCDGDLSRVSITKLAGGYVVSDCGGIVTPPWPAEDAVAFINGLQGRAITGSYASASQGGK